MISHLQAEKKGELAAPQATKRRTKPADTPFTLAALRQRYLQRQAYQCVSASAIRRGTHPPKAHLHGYAQAQKHTKHTATVTHP